MEAFIHDWDSNPQQAQGSLILYWSGHGEVTEQAFYCRLPDTVVASDGLSAPTFSDCCHRESQRRRRFETGGDEPWRILLLDTCYSMEGIHRIDQGIPEPLPFETHSSPALLLIAAGGGTQPHGRLAVELSRVLDDAQTDPERLDVQEVALRLVDCDTTRLRGGVDPKAMWPEQPTVEPVPATVAELREMMTGLPQQALTHFLPTARGGVTFADHDVELSTLPWRFVGRQEVASWLRHATGLLVITGQPGAGKSALLSMVLACAIPGFLDALRERGCDVTVPGADPPPRLQLRRRAASSGQTLSDFVESVALALGLERTDRLEQFIVAVGRRYRDGVRILADALDEAVDPIPIASGLRQFSALPDAKVILGARRSLGERIDDPARGGPHRTHGPRPDRRGRTRPRRHLQVRQGRAPGTERAPG